MDLRSLDSRWIDRTRMDGLVRVLSFYSPVHVNRPIPVMMERINPVRQFYLTDRIVSHWRHSGFRVESSR